MKIIDAFTGREVKVGDTVPMPGGGEFRVAELSLGPLGLALNSIGYALFGRGLIAPKIRVESADQHLNGQWVPLMVRQSHPKYPGQTVAFIPS